MNENTHFDGSDYIPELDQKRLKTQLSTIFDIILDNKWYTLSRLRKFTGFPESSISAQLRNLRKDKFGGHTIEKRRVGNRDSGLFEYRLTTIN